jgi:hypothetical protein
MDGVQALEQLKRYPAPVFHPFFIALTPVLGLYAQNVGMFPVEAIFRPAVLLLLGATLLLLILWALVRDVHKAGVAASLLLFAFLSGWNILESSIAAFVPLVADWPVPTQYLAFAAAVIAGCVLFARWNQTRGKTLWPWLALLAFVVVVLPLAAELLLAPMFGRAVSWFMGAYLILVIVLLGKVIRHQSSLRDVTRGLNWFGLVLTALWLANIALNRPAERGYDVPPLTAKSPPSVAVGEPPPDIYFLVFDGYARGDVLRSLYGYNNVPFINELRTRGFATTTGSRANYPNRELSMASCLNMDYLDALIPASHMDEASLIDVLDLYHDNRLYRFLHDRGYETHMFSPGVEVLEPRASVDVAWRPERTFGDCEMVLVKSSGAARFLEAVSQIRFDTPGYWRYTHHRKRTLYTAERLGPLAATPSNSPRFVYGHFLIPEPPFIFERDGRATDFGLRSTGASETLLATKEEYSQSYREQLDFANKLILESVDAILQGSPRPPVILIASSHGPSSEYFPDDPERTNITERYGTVVFSLFPEAYQTDSNAFNDKISSVNLFRLTLNRLFQTNLPLLPDRILFGTADNLSAIQEVPAPPAL